jgi:hypothetical protein
MTRKVENPPPRVRDGRGEEVRAQAELLAEVAGRGDPGVATRERSAAIDPSKIFKGLSATIPPSVFLGKRQAQRRV